MVRWPVPIYFIRQIDDYSCPVVLEVRQRNCESGMFGAQRTTPVVGIVLDGIFPRSKTNYSSTTTMSESLKWRRRPDKAIK